MIKLLKLYENDSLFEMANRGKDKTGLPFNIYVSLQPHNKKDRTFRVKFQNDYVDRFNPGNLISVIIDINTFKYTLKSKQKVILSDKDIELGVLYVRQNFKAIYDYWNGLIDSDDLGDRCSRIV